MSMWGYETRGRRRLTVAKLDGQLDDNPHAYREEAHPADAGHDLQTISRFKAGIRH